MKRQPRRGHPRLDLARHVDAYAHEAIGAVGDDAPPDVAQPDMAAVGAHQPELDFIGFGARDDSVDRVGHHLAIFVVHMGQEIVDGFDPHAEHRLGVAEPLDLARSHVAFPDVHARRGQREQQSPVAFVEPQHRRIGGADCRNSERPVAADLMKHG